MKRVHLYDDLEFRWKPTSVCQVAVGHLGFMLTALGSGAWSVLIPAIGLRRASVLSGSITPGDRIRAQVAAQIALLDWLEKNLPIDADEVMPVDLRPRSRVRK